MNIYSAACKGEVQQAQLNAYKPEEEMTTVPSTIRAQKFICARSTSFHQREEKQ
jgi:hypothetical protein